MALFTLPLKISCRLNNLAQPLIIEWE
jgi:hypothetical protein